MDYRLDGSVPHLFEAQAQRTPEATALVASPPDSVDQDVSRRQLTYRQLNQQANQVARYLRGQRVGPKVLVGLCVERSPEMIIALLGILKAGGAYVPLDPTYPEERLKFMIADSQISLLLTQHHLLERLPQHEAQGVCLDQILDKLAQMSGENLDLDIAADQLAYVIYTSGSTGRPKGVAIGHRSLLNHNIFISQHYELQPADRVLQFASVSFDVAAEEVFPTLLSGATLVLRPESILDPTRLSQFVAQAGLTVLNLPTSYWHEWVTALNRADAPILPPALRLVIVGTEQASPKMLQLWQKMAGRQVQWINAYGVTETTITTLTYRPNLTVDEVPSSSVPIGRPIANTQAFVLDQQLKPVPVGVTGELYIGGASLAQGYLNQPEFTAERFVANPFSQDPAERLYKTGDLARCLPGGDIEFLGRADYQVKLHGFRIELEEIERVLARFPAIQENVVVIREDEPDDRRLVAYVVATFEEASLSPNILQKEIIRFLQKELPNYMLPATFVFLERLPRTPNGKVDRGRLPAPQQEQTAYTPPRNEAERRLAELWQDILNVERVGRQDNFFALGGDSIKGAVFVNKLQEQLEQYIYVVALFEAPTIAEFIEYLAVHYPAARSRLNGDEIPAPSSLPQTARPIDEAKISQVRRLIKPLRPRDEKPEVKNPSVIFVLSPPRSGSTLLRVMLAGHPDLFAPPELDLLSFNTLADRKAQLSEWDTLRLEGLIRAIMEIKGCDADEAKRLMAEQEAAGLTTAQFYGRLQAWVAPKTVVDKSTAYATDLEILKQAELNFDQARYIHLLRHPYGMISSFETVRLDRIMFKEEHPFSARELAEIMWLISHRNILEFLETIPPERQHRLAFEDVVRQPQATMEQLCSFLDLSPNPALWQPYRNTQDRMTSGLYSQSRMVGDVKFHQHQTIDPQVADSWRGLYTEDFLSDLTWQIAGPFGYRPLESEQTPPLRPIQKSEGSPLSFSQQRLWFLDQLTPGNPVYNLGQATRIRGALKIDRLQKALQTVVARHGALRTTFVKQAGEPRQVIIPQKETALAVIDLGDKPSAKREAVAQRLAKQEMQRPFNLETDSLFRATVLRLDQDNYILVLVMHHIISDGWSLSIIFSEVTALYEAYTARTSPKLPDLRIDYADFAVWQRQRLKQISSSEPVREQLAYWQKQLSGSLPPLQLPLDKPRPPIQTFKGARQDFRISSGLTQSLKKLGQQQNATLFMTLLALFKILLFRYTNQTDLLVGSPVANRNQRELEDLIGFFVNTLVLRTQLSGEMTFRTLLAQIRQIALDAYANQEAPFEELVRMLQPERELSQNPLFQTMFALQNAPAAVMNFGGLTATRLDIDPETAKFDLTLFMEEDETGLHGMFEYNTDLFEAPTIGRMIGHFQTLLAGVVADLDQPLAALPLLTPAERRQLLVTWNDTAAAYPQAQCLPHLFEAQAARTPRAVAAVYEDQQLTYRALNRRANQLAAYLQKQGVGPEGLVGICVTRSLEMMVGLLGILKAGGAYLPLDSTYPPERLAFMLADSQTPILLTEQKLVDKLPDHKGQILCLDTDWGMIAREDDRNPVSDVRPDNLAYVIYTSGSTGQPKGVMIEHRGVVNYLSWALRSYPVGEGQVTPVHSSIGFDLTITSLFTPLLAGQTVVLLPDGDTSEALSNLPNTWGAAGVVKITPAHLEIVEQYLTAEQAQAWAKGIVIGGEALLGEHLAFWRTYAPETRLINEYGPTETVVGCCVYEIEAKTPAAGPAPIGRPIANTQLYILDQRQQPVPIGVPGELYIGGAGVGRGYLNRPELTAEKFIPNPFDKYQTTLYRTGDLARYRPKGNIEFLGRIDQQVKILGYRIELGEIEAILNQHPDLNESVVIVREDAAHDKRLVAYFTSDCNPPPANRTLRDYLAEKMPGYMIPSAFINLDRLPLTANGKIDRRALPAPETRLRTSLDRKQHIPPRNLVELELTQIWEDVLAVQPIGVTDNFFDLGGHSLLAVRLMAKVQQKLGADLSLATLFRGGTVEHLAKALHQQHRPEPQSPLILLQPKGGKTPFFCVHGADGNVFSYVDLAGHLDRERPFYGLQAVGFGKNQLTLEAIAAHYIKAMRTVQPEGPYLLGGWSMGGVVAFEMAQQLRRQQQAVAVLVLIDSQAPAPADKMETGNDSIKGDTKLLIQFLKQLGGRFAKDLPAIPDNFEQLELDEQMSYILKQAARLEYIFPSFDLSQVYQLLQTFKANVRAALDYRPQPYSGRIMYFHASEDQPKISSNSITDWRYLAAGSLEVEVVPGDHYTMLARPRVQHLAEHLKAYLDGQLT